MQSFTAGPFDSFADAKKGPVNYARLRPGVQCRSSCAAEFAFAGESPRGRSSFSAQKRANDSLTSLQFGNGGVQPRGALSNSVFQGDALIIQEQVHAPCLKKVADSQ